MCEHTHAHTHTRARTHTHTCTHMHTCERTHRVKFAVRCSVALAFGYEVCTYCSYLNLLACVQHKEGRHPLILFLLRQTIVLRQLNYVYTVLVKSLTFLSYFYHTSIALPSQITFNPRLELSGFYAKWHLLLC